MDIEREVFPELKHCKMYGGSEFLRNTIAMNSILKPCTMQGKSQDQKLPESRNVELTW